MSFLKTIDADARYILAELDENSKLGVLSAARLVLLTPGFQIVLSIRLQELLGKMPIAGRILRRIIWYWTTIYFGCYIDPEARFGPGLYMPHPVGIVIGGEWDVGSNVSILQGVTLGRTDTPQGRCRIGDRVFIGAGAVIIGQINIGNDARVGANAVVLNSAPAGVTLVGVPATIRRKDEHEAAS